MHPRRTQESYRPRVSDRTMVAILQSSRLSVSGNEWRRHDNAMEPQGWNTISPLHATKRKRTAGPRKTTRAPRVNVQGVGLDAETKILSSPSRGRSISLDIPSHRTAPTNHPFSQQQLSDLSRRQKAATRASRVAPMARRYRIYKGLCSLPSCTGAEGSGPRMPAQ